MTKAERIARLAPLVRIALYVLTGWLGSSFLDPATVSLIRDDPTLLALITGGVAAVWYGLAKWRGWAT